MAASDDRASGVEDCCRPAPGVDHPRSGWFGQPRDEPVVGWPVPTDPPAQWCGRGHRRPQDRPRGGAAREQLDDFEVVTPRRHGNLPHDGVTVERVGVSGCRGRQHDAPALLPPFGDPIVPERPGPMEPAVVLDGQVVVQLPHGRPVGLAASAHGYVRCGSWRGARRCHRVERSFPRLKAAGRAKT